MNDDKPEHKIDFSYLEDLAGNTEYEAKVAKVKLDKKARAKQRYDQIEAGDAQLQSLRARNPNLIFLKPRVKGATKTKAFWAAQKSALIHLVLNPEKSLGGWRKLLREFKESKHSAFTDNIDSCYNTTISNQHIEVINQHLANTDLGIKLPKTVGKTPAFLAAAIKEVLIERENKALREENSELKKMTVIIDPESKTLLYDGYSITPTTKRERGVDVEMYRVRRAGKSDLEFRVTNIIKLIEILNCMN